MALQNGDLECGNPLDEDRKIAEANDDDESLGEYAALVRYIATYRDGRRVSLAVNGDENERKQHWWQRKAKDSSGAGFETPHEWLNTDMKRGLTSAEVEYRRKKTGWNELISEKENMLLKFLSYFTGPILYGKYLCLLA
jgi:H+-transporting ATPase